MAEINWIRESEIWLKDIYDYIAADNPTAAAETITKIYEKAQLLRNHPRLVIATKPSKHAKFAFFSASIIGLLT